MLHITTTSRLVAFALCISVSGCMAAAPEDPSAIGELELPLTSVGSNGTQFALAGKFELIGPETISRVVSANDATFATEDMVTMSPRVGAYNLTLSQWALHRVNANPGGATPPTTPASGAVLLNAATQPVDIQNMQTTTVVYRFSVPGSGTVVFTRGTLNIDFSVGEGFPDGAACTQGSECASLVCSAAQTCVAATCTDGVQNGAETSPDCGGSCICNPNPNPGSPGAVCNGSPGSCGPNLTCVIVGGNQTGVCN